MKKVVKKAAMGSKVNPKPKPSSKSKVKTVDRGMLPNVTVKSIPEFAPMSMEKWRNELTRDVDKIMKKDSTSKMKDGGKAGPKPKAKVKTVDRGMLPNVTVESNPILGLKYKPSAKDMQIDTTSKKKMGGKVAKMAKKVAPKMMKKISKKK
jgi:hypothetical protein